jgi:hypothetical protein
MDTGGAVTSAVISIYALRACQVRCADNRGQHLRRGLQVLLAIIGC